MRIGLGNTSGIIVSGYACKKLLKHLAQVYKTTVINREEISIAGGNASLLDEIAKRIWKRNDWSREVRVTMHGLKEDVRIIFTWSKIERSYTWHSYRSGLVVPIFHRLTGPARVSREADRTRTEWWVDGKIVHSFGKVLQEPSRWKEYFEAHPGHTNVILALHDRGLVDIGHDVAENIRLLGNW